MSSSGKAHAAFDSIAVQALVPGSTHDTITVEAPTLDAQALAATSGAFSLDVAVAGNTTSDSLDVTQAASVGGDAALNGGATVDALRPKVDSQAVAVSANAGTTVGDDMTFEVRAKAAAGVPAFALANPDKPAMSASFSVSDAATADVPEAVLRTKPMVANGEAAIKLRLGDAGDGPDAFTVSRNGASYAAAFPSVLETGGDITVLSGGVHSQAGTDLSMYVGTTRFSTQASGGDFTLHGTGNMVLESKDIKLAATGATPQKLLVNSTNKQVIIQEDGTAAHGLVMQVDSAVPILSSVGATGAINANGLLATNASAGPALSPADGAKTQMSMAVGNAAFTLFKEDGATAAYVEAAPNLHVARIMPQTSSVPLNLGDALTVHDQTSFARLQTEGTKRYMQYQSYDPSTTAVASVFESGYFPSGGNSFLRDVHPSFNGELIWRTMYTPAADHSLYLQGLKVVGDRGNLTQVMLEPQAADTPLKLQNGGGSTNMVLDTTALRVFTQGTTEKLVVDNLALYTDVVKGHTDHQSLQLAGLTLGVDGGNATRIEPTFGKMGLNLYVADASDHTRNLTSPLSLTHDAVALGPTTSAGTLSLDAAAGTVSVGASATAVHIGGSTTGDVIIRGDLRVIGKSELVHDVEHDHKISDRLIEMAAVVDGDGNATTPLAEAQFAADNPANILGPEASGAGRNIAGFLVQTAESAGGASEEADTHHKRFAYGAYSHDGGTTYASDAGAWHTSHALVVGWDKTKPAHYLPVDDTAAWNADATRKSAMYVDNVLGYKSARPHFPQGASGFDYTMQRQFKHHIAPFELQTPEILFYDASAGSDFDQSAGMVYATGVNQSASAVMWHMGFPIEDECQIVGIQVFSNFAYHDPTATDFADGGIVVRVNKLTPGVDASPAAKSSSSNATIAFQDIWMRGQSTDATQVSGPARITGENFMYKQDISLSATPTAGTHFEAPAAPEAGQNGGALLFAPGDICSFGFVTYKGQRYNTNANLAPALRAVVTFQRFTAFEQAGGQL